MEALPHNLKQRANGDSKVAARDRMGDTSAMGFSGGSRQATTMVSREGSATFTPSVCLSHSTRAVSHKSYRCTSHCHHAPLTHHTHNIEHRKTLSGTSSSVCGA
jgi:hypothetical protein